MPTRPLAACGDPALEEGAVDEHAEDDQRKQELERLARQADVGAERLADLEPGERRYRHRQRQPVLRPEDLASTIAPSSTAAGNSRG